MISSRLVIPTSQTFLIPFNTAPDPVEMAYALKDYTNFGWIRSIIQRLHGSSMKAERESGEDAVENPGLQTIPEAVGEFANIFLKSLTDEHRGNLISSPLSAHVVLAMAAYGADGATGAQMRSLLRIPNDNELGQSGFHSLISILNTAKGVELRLANKIYTASQFIVKSTYKELTATKFLSSSEELDFGNSSAAANTINAWCEEQTNKRIKNVITPDALTNDTKLVLVNAVYFKGNWNETFPLHSTRDLPFHVDEKTTKEVPFMCMESKFRFGDLTDLGARFIEIPYRELTFSMIIILPNEINGLQKVLDNLHLMNLSQKLKETRFNDIDLYLPKFEIESSFDLQETLEKLGMTDMFTDQANFSGMADVPLKVSKVIQKAFINVNEYGSEAAAGGVLSTCALSDLDPVSEPPPPFKADRPYYFAIYHSTCAVSLFTGIVTEPKYA